MSKNLIEEDLNISGESEPEDKPILKPKRNYTEEQRKAASERMKKINDERITKAKLAEMKKKELRQLKLDKKKTDLEVELKQLKENVRMKKDIKESGQPKELKAEPEKKQKPKKRNIKIIDYSSSSNSDSESGSESESESDAQSIPEANIIVINRKSKSSKNKLLKKQEEVVEKHVEKQVEPLAIKKPLFKFL